MTVPQELIRKWTKIFHYRDTDNDGWIYKTDFQRYCQKFVDVYGPRAEPVKEVCDILWGTMVSLEHKPYVDLDTFLASYKYQWLNERQMLEDKLRRYANLCFDAIDANGDDQISLEEYTVYQNSFGINNQDYIDLIFHKMDEERNGAINRETFTEELLDYVTLPGPERIHEMYDHFQAKTYRKDPVNSIPIKNC